MPAFLNTTVDQTINFFSLTRFFLLLVVLVAMLCTTVLQSAMIPAQSPTTTEEYRAGPKSANR